MRRNIITQHELIDSPPLLYIYGSKGGELVKCSLFQRGTFPKLLWIVRNHGKGLSKKDKKNLYECIMQFQMTKEVFEEIEDTLDIKNRKGFPIICFNCGSDFLIEICEDIPNIFIKKYIACAKCNTVIKDILTTEN